MNNNIFITNEAARKDPVVVAAMKSILRQMEIESNRDATVQPNTREVSPVNFLQDVMDDLGDPVFRNRERDEYYANGWADSHNGVWQWESY